MSDFIHDDPSFYEDFLVEAQEHFEQIEQNFLTLEGSPGNLDILNGIFRSVHTIKGASGFLGLDSIQSLAHIGENILDELRKGRMQVTPDVMEALFQTTDVLKVMVNDVGISLGRQGEQANPDTTDLKARLEALRVNAGSLPESARSAAAAKVAMAFPGALSFLPDDAKSKIVKAVEGGETVVCLLIKLLPEIVGTKFNPVTTFSLMELIGEPVLSEKYPVDEKSRQPWQTEQYAFDMLMAFVPHESLDIINRMFSGLKNTEVRYFKFSPRLRHHRLRHHRHHHRLKRRHTNSLRPPRRQRRLDSTRRHHRNIRHHKIHTSRHRIRMRLIRARRIRRLPLIREGRMPRPHIPRPAA